MKVVFSALLAGAMMFAVPACVIAQEQPAVHAPAERAAHGQKLEENRASPSLTSGQSEEPEAVKGPARQEAESGTEAFKHSPSVIKLGGVLGLKPELASSVFEWLNFLVLAAAVLYGMAKALPKAFRGRSEKIQKDIVEARAATEEARARLSAVEARLGRLDGEIASLKTESEKAAAEEEVRIREHAEEEKKRILAAAEQEIAAASAAAERDLRAYAAEIAVERAAQQLQITPDDDRLLIESFAGKLTSIKPGAEGSRN